LGSCLAAITACGKRLDASAREGRDPQSDSSATPVAAAIATAAENPAISPKADSAQRTEVAPSGAEPKESKQLIALTPKGLEAMVRGANRKGTLVNVWATWCGPCREELPLLAKIQREYRERGLEVLPLSVDEPEKYKEIAPMLKSYGFAGPYFVIAEPLAAMKRYLSEKWQGNVPVSFLLGADATRHYFFAAEVFENELRPKLELFLQGNLETGEANFAVAPGKTF
jgi:thiol-disulfide isomerase/thioredoxin